jgi:hypothetical protein
MKLKPTEARILVYLDQVKNELKYSVMMARKLDIDYNHLLRTLGNMLHKGWLRRNSSKGSNKKFYETNNVSLVLAAKNQLEKQRRRKRTTISLVDEEVKL